MLLHAAGAVQQQLERAQDVVDNGVSWLEFSVQIPKTRQALKVGYTQQESVGRFP